MATVFLADDLKHERKVALKVLKPELAAVVGAERFLAEIKTTANLQHPHILPLFDSGEADGFLFYVMPHVEGESLRERLDRDKQLPVDEAVQITTAVAHALQHAHDRGVVHRDVKPANILMQDGQPVVADFGIALAVGAAGGSRLTETGLSVGTPFYMSPEQATGDQQVGPPSDTYALAAVLYEMLTGDPPYIGSTAQAVLGKIIQGAPVSATQIRKSVPANVDAAIRKALEKLPADRFTGAQDFAKALGDAGFRHGDRVGAGVAAGVGPWKRLAVIGWSVAALTTLAAIVLMLRGGAPIATPAVPLRMPLADFEFEAPANTGGNRMAISSDGSQIALSSDVNGVPRIFLRDAGQPGFREIPGTEGGHHPGFSPDGEWLVFETPGGISRVEVSGGPILPIAMGRYPHWGLDDMVVFQGPSGGLYRVAPSGGDPVLILERVTSTRPYLLPDGRAVVFEGPSGEGRGLMLVEIESGKITDLGVTGDNPRYVPTGHLVYGHQSQALMAIPFDLKTHRVTGQPSTVLPDVTVYQGGATQFAVSETGTAVYITTTGGGSVTPVWVERDGTAQEIDPAWNFRMSPSSGPALSPDGTHLALSISDSENKRDVWVKQLDTGPMSRLTFEGRVNTRPRWSPDGQSLIFMSNRAGNQDSWTKRADGSGTAELLLDRELTLQEAELSPDNAWLIFREAADIYAARLPMDSAVVPLEVTDFRETSLSPPTGAGLRLSPTVRDPMRFSCVLFPMRARPCDKCPETGGANRCGRTAVRNCSTGTVLVN